MHLPSGTDGYTPVKGTDYWTDEDKAEIEADNIAYITDELAKRGQLKPEFANSVDECTDESLLYVLPDGYIYAYMCTEKEAYTNLADPNESNTTDTSIWINNYRIASSALVANSGTFVSNKIYCSKGDVIRIKGISPIENADRIASFMEDDTGFLYQYFSALPVEGQYDYTINEDVLELTPLSESVAYVRFSTSIPTDLNSIIVTLNEEITENTVVTTYGWENTGHAFVPADYEDRILQLEETTSENTENITILEQSIKELEENMTSSEISCPDYWVTAIEELSDTIKSKQSNGVNAFQFVWFSDMHGTTGYPNTNGAGQSSQVNIGKVSQYLCDIFDIPLVITSGDIMSQTSHSSVETVYTEYKNCREILSYIDTDRFLATIGNHDGAWGAPVDGKYYLKDIGNRALYNEVYRKQATDLTRVFGDDGTYFYIDSKSQKIRILMLNGHTDGDGSNDEDGLAIYSSMWNSVYGTEQLQWIADTLNSVPDGYKVIAFAHEPLTESNDGNLVASLFEAYNNKTSYSNEINVQSDYWGKDLTDSPYILSKVNCDFTNAKGEFIAYFHGHIHYDRVDTTSYDFPCISITTAGGDVRDSNPVERIVGTATETALDVVTIDKEARIIYMTRVGAGIDREITY